MENFTFGDLAEAVAERTGLSVRASREAVQAAIDVIGTETASGKRVKLGNFGSFERGMHSYTTKGLDGRVYSGKAPVIRFTVSGLLRSALRSGAPFTTLRRAPKSYR